MTTQDLPFIIDAGSQESNFSTTPTSAGFWTTEQLTNSINSQDDVLLVAEADGEIVGFCISLLHRPTGKATFENLWVHPNYRKEGVGQQLIERMIENLKDNGCVYICGLTKEDNEPMLNLFEKVGFEKGYTFRWISKKL